MDRNAEPGTFVRALEKNAARIEAVGSALSAEQLVAAPAEGAWSPNQILWHIRATADVYGEHIKRILAEDEPRWRHVSPRARMKKVAYDRLPFAESSAAFAKQRTELLAHLSELAPGAWERVALVFVPHNKREWRLALRGCVWGMADHEAGHCAQMEAVAGALGERA